MRTLLITDSNDAKVGLRLAGIETTVVALSEQALDAIKAAIKDADIGLILVTERLAAPIHKQILELKLSLRGTMILTIPDPGDDFQDHIGQYVSQSIGIKY